MSAQRQSGFEHALHEAGLAVHPEWVRPGSFSYRSGLAAAEQILTAPDPSETRAPREGV